MQLADYIIEQSTKERVEYIFGCFQQVFPNVRYDERESIIGVGEEGKQLLCYFKISDDGQKLVKFKKKNEPMSLFIDIEVIDEYIQATIKHFQENDLTLRPQKERREKKPQEIVEIKKAVDTTERGKELETLLSLVPDTFDRCDIETVASARLSNAFNEAGIKTIKDLRKWTYTEIMQIQWIGEKSYLELTNILKSLVVGIVPEGCGKNKLGFLNLKSTNKTVRKWENKAETKAYLASIDYDETRFEPNSLGRVLCLRKKLQDNPADIRFVGDQVVVTSQYAIGQEKFTEYCPRFENLLYEILQAVAEPERNLPMVSAYYGLGCAPSTMQEVGAQYGLTRERVNQVQKKLLSKYSNYFSLHKEDGILRFLKKTQFLQELSEFGIEAFLIYLKCQRRHSLFKAFKRVMFYKVILPDNFDELIDEAYSIISKKSKANKPKQEKELKSGKLSYQGFELILDDDGEIKTDIELLMKLKDKRMEIASEQKVPAYMICHNKYLVALATFKPVNKDMYIALSGFTSNTWEKHGYMLVEVIREHKSN